MRTIYIAGPMRGYPEFNFPAFFAAEDRIAWAAALAGDKPRIFNPARLDIEEDGVDVTWTTGNESELEGFDLKHAFKRDLLKICEADEIYMLKRWEHSMGARAEHAVAVALGLTVRYE